MKYKATPDNSDIKGNEDGRCEPVGAVLVPRATLEKVREALHELRVSHQILDDMHCNDMLRRDTTSPADEKAWAALAALEALGE